MNKKGFKLENYHDEYLARVKEAVQKKINGEALPVGQEPENNGGAFDLEALLAGSLKNDEEKKDAS